MKKVLTKIVLIMGFLIAVLSVCNAIRFEVGKVTGAYVATNAKITYVHEYVQRSHSRRCANGYFAWEYDGIKHEIQNERSSMVDLIYGDKEGDIISIWVNKSNGKFEAVNNKYTDRSVILAAILIPIFYIVIFLILTRTSSAAK